MFAFRSVFSQRRSRPRVSRPARRQWPPARPRLEPLEDRTLPATRLVVPLGAAADNLTTFHSLATALNTPGISAGDTVVIERGSTPGNIQNSDVPAVSNLTIEGDPALGNADLPTFGVANSVTITQPRFTLFNVNVSLLGGSLIFGPAATGGRILSSTITNNFNLGGGVGAVQLNSSAAVVDGDVITSNAGQTDSILLAVSPLASSGNRITANTFLSTGPNGQALLEYLNLANTAQDVVAGNSFLGNTGPSDALLMIAGGVNTLTVRDNTFQDADKSQVAINVGAGVQFLTLGGNAITLTGPSGTTGISVAAGAAGTTTSALVSANRIDTGGNGTGLALAPGAPGSIFNARVEGNDFHTNTIGISITAGLNGSASGIDLGGGAQGSLGANNFRGFTATATSTSGAIVVGASLGQGSVNAQKNIFASSVSGPETVVWDSNDNPSLLDVNESSPLTGNAAFVAVLYATFLKRARDLSNPNDAGGSLAALNAGVISPAGVADGIVRSPEALGLQVDALYRRFLGREADPAGRAGFVAFLQNGGTLEQASTAILASGEYQARFGSSDAAFIESLYVRVLNRFPSSGEVAGWVAVLPQLGRAGVAQQFLGSAEYRGKQVRLFYRTLLHRTPTSQEVSGWVNSPADLLSIESSFAGSTEFQTNG